MFVVRGNNVFPPALEAVVRRFPEVAEFRATVYERGPLAQVSVEVEPAPDARPEALATLAERVGRALHDELHFRAEVQTVAPGTLPRFEMKAKRFVRVRQTPTGA